MYDTFCTSSKFFSKLVERYSVDETSEYSQYSEGAVRELRLRICDIIATWIEKRYLELDSTTVEQMKHFITVNLVNDGFAEQSEKLQSLIDAKRKQQENSLENGNARFESIPKLEWNKVNGESLYQIFLSASEKTIAEQLTLQDWKIFKRIQVSRS